jgi:hypothetical protein
MRCSWSGHWHGLEHERSCIGARCIGLPTVGHAGVSSGDLGLDNTGTLDLYEYGTLAISGASLAVQWELRVARTQEVLSSRSAAHDVAPATGTLSLATLLCARDVVRGV